MPEDSSLDAFASSEEEDAADTEEDATAEPEVDAEAEETEPESVAKSVETAESVEPAVSTYAWSPDGGTCADCGESVAKRWRAEGQRDGDLVCADCKVW